MNKDTIKEAVEAAERDFKAGHQPSANRHDAIESSIWADWYLQAYQDLAEAAEREKNKNTAQSISAFLAEHTKVPVRFEGHLLTPTEAQAKLALGKYADDTFSIFLRRHLLEIIRE